MQDYLLIQQAHHLVMIFQEITVIKKQTKWQKTITKQHQLKIDINL
jgi:hypothetical protein